MARPIQAREDLMAGKRKGQSRTGLPQPEITFSAQASRLSDQEDQHTGKNDDHQRDGVLREAKEIAIGLQMRRIVHRRTAFGGIDIQGSTPQCSDF
jgi:hypothetical protein